jgi:hypothetical protein
MSMKKNNPRIIGHRAIGAVFALLLLTTSSASRAEFLAGLGPAGTEISSHWIDTSFLESELAAEASGWETIEQPSEYSSYGDARPEVSQREFSLCGDCEFHLGVGGTYNSFGGTRGVVIPMTISWDRSRWEFGMFHFSEQFSSDNPENVDQVVARPYWGASLSRRFQFFERGPLRAIFGFGLSYRTETDVLSATHWNFSSQLGLRFQSPRFPAILELSARHWSNGGVRHPNRGQDFTILTVRFER